MSDDTAARYSVEETNEVFAETRHRLIFLSHAAADVWVAKQISKEVRATGVETFLYEINVDIGDDFDEVIRDKLCSCFELIALITPNSVDRKYIWAELGAAWALRKRYIVVAYGMTIDEIVSLPEIPNFIRRKNLIHINDLDKYINQLRELVAVGAANA